MTAPDDVRARFEAWAAGHHFRLERSGDYYMDRDTAWAWITWKAAHADLSGEVRELVEDVRWLLLQIPHNEFSHDYIKDEKRCETCKRIKRIHADHAKFTQEKP